MYNFIPFEEEEQTKVKYSGPSEGGPTNYQPSWESFK